jgi:cell division protein FtsQ
MASVDGPMVADRVARHPWVKTATVTKQRARRTLQVAVTERAPAAIVVDGSGRPAYYLDPAGYAMPVPDSAETDVPLVRSLDAAYHPVRRVAPPALRAVLGALPATGTESLVAEVVVRPDSSVDLVTTPVGAYDALSVRLGTGRIRAKLRRLRAFAEQVLATRPKKSIGEIDLRFDGQIVTREHPLDG